MLSSLLKGKRSISSKLHNTKQNPSMGSVPARGTDGTAYHLFNSSKTISSLRQALRVSSLTAANGGTVLFIGVSPTIPKLSSGTYGAKSQGTFGTPYGRILEAAAYACNQPCFNADHQT